MSTMRIQEFGSENKETIILLHGGGLSWWNYKEEASLLSDRFHVVVPILDGHAGSDHSFTGIEENAGRIISYIDRECNGSVLLIGGLSLGAQILVEMLSQRADICQFAVVESASVIPSPMTNSLIGPTFASSYGLIQKKWFAKTQFKYLRIRDDLFEDYYTDTSKILKDDMIAFLKANTMYQPKPALKNCQAKVRIVVGEKEQKKMRDSAKLLSEILPESSLEVKTGLYHGEYSINHPKQYCKDLLEMIH